jgi:L-iditol 2-dehydrogenase
VRQAVIQRPHELEFVEAPPPRPEAGELLVRSVVVGICGSDIHALEGQHPFIRLPVVPGHEVAGVVEAVGAGVEDFATGDRVLLEPNLVCGRCFYCASGRYNLCSQLLVVGCQTEGGLADLFTAPARRFHMVPEGMSMTQAAVVEPLSTATHAVRIAGDLRGAPVAVLGAGSIGLLTMLAARAAGATAVIVTDPVEGKRRRAVELGATGAVDPMAPDAVERVRAELPHRPDVTFDCVANQASTEQAIALAEKGGTVVVVGVPRGPVTIALPIVQDREIRLQGSAMYVAEDVRRAVELMQLGAVPVDRIVTAVFPLERTAEAFAAARSGEHVKVQVRVSEQPGL